MFYLSSYVASAETKFTGLSQLIIWSQVETGISITVASLATLRPLFNQAVEVVRRSGPRSRQQIQDTNSQATDMSDSTGLNQTEKLNSMSTVAPASF
jgi:hypothetical protein